MRVPPKLLDDSIYTLAVQPNTVDEFGSTLTAITELERSKFSDTLIRVVNERFLETTSNLARGLIAFTNLALSRQFPSDVDTLGFYSRIDKLLESDDPLELAKGCLCLWRGGPMFPPIGTNTKYWSQFTPESVVRDHMKVEQVHEAAIENARSITFLKARKAIHRLLSMSANWSRFTAAWIVGVSHSFDNWKFDQTDTVTLIPKLIEVWKSEKIPDMQNVLRLQLRDYQ